MTSHSIITTRAQSRVLEECQEALNVPSTSRNDLAEGEFLSFSNRNTLPGAPALIPLLRPLLRAAPMSLEFTPHVVSTTPWTPTVTATLVAMVVAVEIATRLLPTHQMFRYQTPLSLPLQLRLQTPCSYLHRRSRR